MIRHYALSTYFRQHFGQRISKVPLDAGATCPNRDGHLSANGCIFCNEKGSGTGLSDKGLDIAGQWEQWRTRGGAKFAHAPAMAYLQSFSNTYCTPERLRELVAKLENLPHLAGICLGTRPDCLDDERLEILAAANVDEFWLDLGLQSSNDDTLRRINRGHDSACFAQAAHKAHCLGLKVCGHIIGGLPGEGPEEFIDSALFISDLPVAGIKMHNLFVCKGAPLYQLFANEAYIPMEREAYIEAVVNALTRIRSNIVIHRLASDPAPGELVAPHWAASKLETLNSITRLMNQRDCWQGQQADAADQMPAWFKAQHEPPVSFTNIHKETPCAFQTKSNS